MPRKTNGNGTTSRRKRAVASTETLPGQVVAGGSNGASTKDLNEEIRLRAYEIYLERRGCAGDEHQDWLSAEREIRARHQQGYSV